MRADSDPDLVEIDSRGLPDDALEWADTAVCVGGPSASRKELRHSGHVDPHTSGIGRQKKWIALDTSEALTSLEIMAWRRVASAMGCRTRVVPLSLPATQPLCGLLG